MVNLSFVKLIKTKNKLKRDQYKNEIKKIICEKVREIENLGSLKFDNELLRFVCNCVENSLKQKYEKKEKTDKKQLVIEIYHNIFGLNDDEKNKLSNNIDFIIENNLVENVNLFYKCGLLSFEYLKSKL